MIWKKLPATYFILSIGSSCSEATLKRRAYSIYSVIRWRKLKGSLNITGIVILLSSFPIQFFKTDQILKSLRENMATGREVLKIYKNYSLERKKNLSLFYLNFGAQFGFTAKRSFSQFYLNWCSFCSFCSACWLFSAIF